MREFKRKLNKLETNTPGRVFSHVVFQESLGLSSAVLGVLGQNFKSHSENAK